MFLAQLDRDELNLFIDLGIYAAKSNGEIDLYQKNFLQIYMRTVERDENNFEVDSDLSIILDEIKEKCSEEVITIMFVEIIQLIMLDKHYDSSEQKFIINMQRHFGIADEKVGKIFQGVTYIIEG